jgi:hypothetical protein
MRDKSPSPPHELHSSGMGGYVSFHEGVQIVSRNSQLWI